jgi:signal transduction histidine kinase
LQNLDKEASQLTLLFEVFDTGAGFDAADESIMFKPFSQVDSSVGSILLITQLLLIASFFYRVPVNMEVVVLVWSSLDS